VTCDDALHELLDAELEVLGRPGEGELAEHLRSCARCRDIASRLVENERTLAEALARHALQPKATVVGSIVARARVEEAERQSISILRPHVPRRWALWAPALAAEALVGIMLWPSGKPVDPRTVVPAPRVPPPPRIQPPPGTDAAVLATSNPSITVVWLLGGTDR
jgi:hypothetical protein